MNRKTFFLNPLAPFRLDLTVWTLRRREHNQIDRWDGVTYRRVLIIDGQPVEIEVTQVGPADSPRLRVTLIGAEVDSKIKKPVISHLTRMLGLQVDLGEFYEFAFRQPKLGPLVRRFRGMRPPRFPSVFEALVNATACQQMSLTVGIIMLNRLAGACGLTLEENGVVTHAFPRPQDLVHRDPQAIAALGFSRQKVRAMTESASAIDKGQLDVESLSRAFGRISFGQFAGTAGSGGVVGGVCPAARPGDGLMFFRATTWAHATTCGRWLGLTKPLDYESVREELSRFGEYAGLVYFHLLLDRLSEAGELDASKSPMEARKGTALAVE